MKKRIDEIAAEVSEEYSPAWAQVVKSTYRAAKEARFSAMRVEVKTGPLQEPYFESGVGIVAVQITTDHKYQTLCSVSVRSSSGHIAEGHGVSVKGRKDVFDASVGAAIALRRAFKNAFTILGQMDGTDPLLYGEEPFDVIGLSVEQSNYIGVHLLTTRGRG